MIRKSTQVKVAAAFNLLKKYNIRCFVPGCYDIDTAAEAVMFANDKDDFYRMMGSTHMVGMGK